MDSTWFPTFVRWLTTVRVVTPARWRIAPWWRLDTWATQQRTLLRMLSTAVANHLALAPMVAELAEDHRGPFRWKLNRLAKQLAAGTSLADAVEHTPGVLSTEQTLAVRFGAQSGTLPEVLTSLIGQEGIATSRISCRVQQAANYFAGVVFVMTLVVSFLMIKILPEFSKMFAEFGLEPTTALDALLACGTFLSQFWYLFALLLLAAWWFFYSQTGWRYFHRTWLPRFSRLANRLIGADLLGMLALAKQQGRPLAGAISTLARYHYNQRVRTQLLYVRNEIEQGAEVWPSMTRAGLISAAESNALLTAPDEAARLWSMQQLADLRRRRVAERLEMLIDLLHPCVVLLLAGLVLFVAFATLGPLTYLIRSLA